MTMTVFQIQCFLSVAETLNFTEAANRLFIAQSSLSRNISHLEEEIGLGYADGQTVFIDIGQIPGIQCDPHNIISGAQ